MSKRSFVHLHTHTEFSMLDGASRISDLVEAAVADCQPALGITDHGNMYGVLDFYRSCRDADITPVIGFEAYMAAESRTERPVRRGRVDDTGGEAGGGEKLYYHLTLLAETSDGYRNLMKLSSAAYLEGYYYKPRVDWELLQRHHDGVIATSGCLGGVVLQYLLRGDYEAAEKAAGRLQEIFGKQNFFVEIQDHGIASQRRTNPDLVKIARRIGAPLLATNDSHYTRRGDAIAHDAMLCVQTGATLEDPKRFKFEGEEHFLKSCAEMRDLFADFPEACDATLAIAERSNVEIEFGRDSLPEFPLPGELGDLDYNEGAAIYLRQLTKEGAEQRYGHPLATNVAERIDYELNVISSMGFSAYFLVVWDLICHARSSGIRVGPGRGSAAGCCVAYCLGIVDLDPIRYDLLFERFLNPGRKQMPDIDMDFDERYRAEMIRYASERYGWDHVAQIVTFSTIKARAAVRDAARVLGYPYAIGDRIAKAMPPLVMGRDTPLRACLDRDEEHADGFEAAQALREMYESEPDVRRITDVARGLEGLRRQDGIHAAAVVITKEPLTEYLPVQRKPETGTDPQNAPVVTQYEMHGVEALGLLKMDFLGLRTLSLIERALDLIEESTGTRPDIDRVDFEDKLTFEMLQRGETVGIFQLESGPMRSLIRSLAPTSIDDVAALVALYRPGPMAQNMHRDYADRKNSRQEVKYLHPDLEEILKDTYGLMIYQESVMRVAQRFAGYTLEEADNLRKACGKKDRRLIAAEREKFVAGCVEHGYGAELGTSLFDIIEPFADYAFNKSHSYGYGIIAFQTAWLKANYPVEYMAALLTSVKGDKDKTAVYLAECRGMGISVHVPDVNLSASDFTARRADEASGGESGIPVKDASAASGTILFGLAAVRNVGEGLVSLVVQERQAHGLFKDFYDFCERVDPVVLNKRAVESLIKAGAFDSLGHSRKGLSMVFEDVVERTLARRREAQLGIDTLFAALDDAAALDGSSNGDAPDVLGPGGTVQDIGGSRVPIPDEEFDKAQRIAFEKELLGLYVSDHPLTGVEAQLRRITDCGVADLKELAGASGQAGRETIVKTLGGVVTNMVRRTTRRGDPMLTFTLEDVEASIEVVAFPKVAGEYGGILAEDVVVCVKGKLDVREDEIKLICLEVSRPELSGSSIAELHLNLPVGALTGSNVDALKQLLLEHPGGSCVYLHIGTKVLKLPGEFSVDDRGGLIGELRALLGPKAIVA